MKCTKITKEYAYFKCQEALNKFPDRTYLDIEIKKHKEIRTLNQNAFFHHLCGWLGHELGMDASLIKDGIKERYGVRVKVFGEYVPKPSHLCNKFEEMNALIEGCFIEAGEQGIDTREKVLEWEQIKKERLKKQSQIIPK